MDVDDMYVMEPHQVKEGQDLDIDFVTAETYKMKLVIRIIHCNNSDLEFDMIGVYPGFINALRRILISEVPSMAIEKVHIYNNTSIIQDEVLAHRLGLIPLKADSRYFDFHNPGLVKYTSKDSLQFEIDTSCSSNPGARFGHHRAEDRFFNSSVYSGDLKWVPLEGQENLFREDVVGPVESDILIAKLRPGQEIQATLIAVKGIGRDHAKFSPVATASYRLHPYIALTERVEGEQAVKLQSCFSEGVIGLEEEGNGNVYAVVKDARLDTCSRNFMRHPELKDKVVLGRLPEHYIMIVESCIGVPPDELVKEAIKILKKKCKVSLLKLKELLK